jgi:hypothetical protein
MATRSRRNGNFVPSKGFEDIAQCGILGRNGSFTPPLFLALLCSLSCRQLEPMNDVVRNTNGAAPPEAAESDADQSPMPER